MTKKVTAHTKQNLYLCLCFTHQ